MLLELGDDGLQVVALLAGDAELLALGAALQRYSRDTGVPIDEAVRMIRSGRRNAPERGRRTRTPDRRQLALWMMR